MVLDRTKIQLGTSSTQPSVAWENEIVNGVNGLLNNIIEVDFTSGYVNGFYFSYLSNNKMISISPGVCVDKTTNELINLEYQYVLNVPGSLDIGTFTSNTWYYVWIIKNDNNVISFLVSLSDSTPTFSGKGFIHKRLIGAIYVTSSSGDVRRYDQIGLGAQRDFFQLDQSDILTTTTFTNNVYNSLSVNSYAPSTSLCRRIFVSGILRHTVAGTQGEATFSLRHGTSSSSVGTYNGILKGYTNSASRIFGDICIGGLLKTNSSNEISWAVRNDNTAGTKEVIIVSLGFRLNV